MPGGREPRLRPGNVEAYDAAIAVGKGELRNLHGLVEVAHCTQDLVRLDRVPAETCFRLASVESRLDCVHRLLKSHAALEVLIGCPADFAINDSVGREVLYELGCNSFQSVF